MGIDVERMPDPGMANSAWLVDLGDGSALVVDPSRDPRGPLDAAEKRGLQIRWVAETHLHADFVSGARELLNEVDGTHLIASADAGLAYDHEPVGEGDEVNLGGLVLRPLATPGHSPEHLAYLLLDDGQPQAVFSGGTLIVDGVARTDLVSPDLTEPLARQAWRSITSRLLTLPDDLAVYPTHGGGSFCAAGSSDRAGTTIGEQRSSNPLLQAADEEAFVERLLSKLGSYPPYFLRLREVNRRGPRVYGTATPALERIDVDEVERRRAAGGEVIDVRPITDYGSGHVPGSLSIELQDQFATWVGWLVHDADTPLMFIVGEDQDRDELVRHCLKVGYENLAGELAGGIGAWLDAGREIATTELTDVPQEDRRIIDVRQQSEWEAEHLPDATHVELGTLTSVADNLPREGMITHCVHGQRSMTGASLLERAGRHDVAVFTGGPDEWERHRHTDS